MRLKIFSTLVACSIAMCAAAKTYNYQSVAGDPMQTRIYTLDNGLKVYLSVNKDEPRIVANIAVKTGSRNDPAATTGLAHYLEHLMFKGSKTLGTTNYAAEAPLLQKISDLYEVYRTMKDPEERRKKYHEIDSISQIAAKYFIPNELDKSLAMIGAEGTNAYTSYDQTVYVGDLPSNELERWCMLQADRFQNMVIRGFHTELEAVYEEKNMTMTRDIRKLVEALYTKLYPSHPYGTQTTIGTQEHLKNPSIVNIKEYFKRYYVPNNVAICMAGDLNPDETIATIDKYFGMWQPAASVKVPQFKAQPKYTTPQDTTVVGQEEENIALAWRTDGAASLQNDTARMVGLLLSNGFVGLIDNDINQKMLTHSADAGVNLMHDYGCFYLMGSPNAGQTLDEVKQLLLDEVEKIKRGEWDEKLLRSIMANERCNDLNSLDHNRMRVNQMVNTYVNDVPWEQHVTVNDRMEKLTKADIMKWATEHLDNGYVCVRKVKGEDTTIVKIEKPLITPIPSNRDKQSQFITDLEKVKPTDIQPVFTDFKTDLTFGTTKRGLPIIYKQNTTDQRFRLTYHYEFGFRADKNYEYAGQYYDLLGTKKETVEQIKRDFYDMACSYSVNVSARTIDISLSGLQENMGKAVAKLDQYLRNLKPDTALYRQFVDQEQKYRTEMRNTQIECYSALCQYALFGDNNPTTDKPSISQMRATSPTVYTDAIKSLYDIKHEVTYWGPATMQQLAAIIDKQHKSGKKLTDGPQNKTYNYWQTTTDEVVYAPYDAANTYLRMISSEGKTTDLQQRPCISLFNSYFGNDMKSIVFQELRESRALAYNAFANYNTADFPGAKESFMKHIITQNDKLFDCVGAFNQLTDTVPQSEANLQIAKQGMMKSIASARYTRSEVIDQYLNARRLGIDYDLGRTFYQVIPTLTMQDIMNFARTNVSHKPQRYAVLGRETDIDFERLGKIGPVRRLTLDDIFPATK